MTFDCSALPHVPSARLFLMRVDIDVVFFRTHSFQGYSIISLLWSNKNLLRAFEDIFLYLPWSQRNPGSFLLLSALPLSIASRCSTSEIGQESLLTHLIQSKREWVREKNNEGKTFIIWCKKWETERERRRGTEWLHSRGVDVFFHRHSKTFQIPAKTSVFCYSFLLSFHDKRRIFIPVLTPLSVIRLQVDLPLFL